jgi:hypothetical protein
MFWIEFFSKYRRIEIVCCFNGEFVVANPSMSGNVLTICLSPMTTIKDWGDTPSIMS